MSEPWYASLPLSMAHLCELDTPPAELITAAAAAGLASVGFRIEPAAPGGIEYPLRTAAEQAEVRRRCNETGVGVLYVELISLSERTVAADHRRLLETGAAIGASRLTVAGDSTDLALVADKLGEICDLAAPLGIAVDLEFMPFRGVRSLADALAVVRECGRSNAHILIDALHIMRSATPVASIRALDPRLVGTFQICDGPLAAPARADLVTEARTRRLIPGEGQFPLIDMLDALPAGTPIGVEVPMATWMAEEPPAARLLHLVSTTRNLLNSGRRA